MNVVAVDFRAAIADRIEAAPEQLASRWLAELERLVAASSDGIFPGDELLGTIPALILDLAAFLRAPVQESIAANASVTARAAELGRLRHAQQASVHQVLREYRTLRTVFAEFVDDEIMRLRLTAQAHDVIDLMNRLEAAIDVLLQTTIDTFVAEYTDTITQHASKLEGFNRMVTHELRQPIGVFQMAVKLLGIDDAWKDRGRREQILATVDRNVARINETLGKLVALSRSGEESDNALVQRVELSGVVRDVIDQLREMADARDVEVRVGRGLPAMTIDVARLELALVNLLSNAIKYSDPNKSRKVVEVACAASSRPEICTISIRDNGLGIAEADLRSIFARFYRGHADRDRELGTSGLGLGLSIVADCVDALKGEIRVESTLGEGTTFYLELPVSPTS